ncbi:GntR family transcriptional regulator [Halioxenophilus sp. WMMB6]|uniref:GntR family transcriptional regulator n=1 Tax=Halioxenophilus sp. WMMB6 TaxID=3073815 RepID=UPI00295E9929|nr:GntR family transcriptional regulator [Halioxenophilus sp. WMMB6]
MATPEHSLEDTLGSHITTTLRNAIVCGDIKPGTKLSEPKLAREYHISRGPLREAIRRLESMKLVKYVPREGARVITLDLPQVIEIYHIREALESKAAALAAHNISEDGLNKLKHLLALAEQHMATSGGAYIQADVDIDFHYQVIQSSGNQMLIHLLCEELYYLIRMYRYQSSLQPNRSHNALIEHQQLIMALEQRDEQLAEMIMRKHIVRARQNIEQQILKS